MAIKFSFGKCKTKATYSARLEQKGSMDLNKIKQAFKVTLETPILLVIAVEDMEIVVHGYGELLFKKGSDAATMEKLAEQIYAVGLKKG